MLSNQQAKLNQSGYSAVEVLLIVLVVVALSATGFVVYQRHKSTSAKSNATTSPNQTTSQSQSTTTTQTQQTTAAKTHQAADGSFSFSYPTDWYINESLNTLAAEDEISLAPVSAQTPNANAFRMILFVVSNPDAQPGYLPDGTVQKLTNGINLWTSSLARSQVPASPTSTTMMACPRIKIVSSDEKHFSYPLKNGKFLMLTAGYCQSDKDTTSQTYDQLLAGQAWQSAVAIIQSIKFH
jgi:cytoskeletal protein RodZ